MSTILNRVHLVTRQIFDPKNEQHIASLKNYLRTGNWGNVQFYAELPFVEVPATVITKYTEHMLNVQRETAQERDARLNEMQVIRA